ncbi:uncharacterized protein LOC114334623 isoform X2 [Diabrotica virgifera virgifera]|uniref:BZIP domain-containing protein n=1 Tax=Diabrotica virgifera virgifera TaxID=50390 RepID=A0ABM5JPN4_DIAVI|nr:uncharacterized protein LOC114334623 isoform X2 [Diabrotica virgifera virgifera]
MSKKKVILCRCVLWSWQKIHVQNKPGNGWMVFRRFLQIFQKVEQDDGLPQNICDSCIEKLEELSDFIDLVKYNHSCLKQVHTIKSAVKPNNIKWQNDNHNDQHKEFHKYYDESLDAVAVVKTNGSGEASEKVVELQIIEPVLMKVEELYDEDTGNEDEELGNNTSRKTNYALFQQGLSEEEIRLLRRRAGNRKAAAKRRKKVQDHLDGLVKDANSLAKINKLLKIQVTELERGKRHLLSLLSKFKCSKQHLDVLEERLKQKSS